MSNWAVLCPGPSLPKYNREFVYDPNCTIAVNGAILHFPANYWAIIDDEVFTSVYNKRRRHVEDISYGTTLWIPEKWIGRAEKGKVSPIFWSFRMETFTNLPGEMPIGRGWRWNEKTIFAAIALAVKKGARIIRVYGADMKGVGYYTEGLENKKMVHTMGRWHEERILFEQAQGICKKNGIELERMMA